MNRSDFAPGDILGFAYPFDWRDWYGTGISLATFGWPGRTPIHCAAVGSDGIYEAVGKVHLPPVRPLGAASGVVLSPFPERIYHHVEEHRGRLYRYRPRDRLSGEQLSRMGRFLDQQLGKPFDHRGQFWARTLGLGWLQRRLFPFGADHYVSWWCSRLAWCAWREAGLVWGVSWVRAPGPMLRWLVRNGVCTETRIA